MLKPDAEGLSPEEIRERTEADRAATAVGGSPEKETSGELAPEAGGRKTRR
jgi:hypothetical protein